MCAYKVNFLPPRLQQEGLIDFRRLILLGGTTLFVAVVVGAYGAFLIHYFSMKNELAAAKQQFGSLAPLVARVEAVVQERKELEAAIAEFDLITTKQAAWSNTLFSLLSDLPGITPMDVWLTSMDVLNKGASAATAETAGQGQNGADIYMRADTIVLKGSSATVPSIGVLIKNLNGLPHFSEVKLDRISSENTEIKFEITATIRDGN